MPAPFHPDEYHRRLTSVRAAMDERQLDVLIVGDPANMNWLTGFDAWSCFSATAIGGIELVPKKYKLINKETGKVYKEYHRRPKFKDWSQRWIVGMKAETEGKLQVVRS